jgi:hypothetical protein
LTFNKDEELKLWKAYKASGFKNQTILVQLLRAHQAIINTHVIKYSNPNIPRTALEAEARLLAMKAYETYKPGLAGLTTHMFTYLKKLYRYVASYANLASIPEARVGLIAPYQKAVSDFKDQHGEFKEPSVDFLSSKLKASKKVIKMLRDELRNDLGTGVGDSEDLMGISYNLPDETLEALRFARFEMDPIGQLVIDYKFGLNNKPKLNDKDIMHKLKLSNYALKAIAEKIIIKLKGHL